MKFIHSILAFLLLALLFSCETARDLGTDLQGENQLLETAFTDTLTVNAYIMQMDSVSTLNSTDMLVGSCHDAILNANYYAEGYSKMYILERDSAIFSYVWYKGVKYATVYDSISMSLRYKTYAGDSTVPQTFDVYRLSEALKDSTPYFNNSSLEATELIGSGTFKGKDEKSQYLFFKLKDALGREFFSKSGGKEFLNAENFSEMFKGIKIKAREKKNAAVISLDLIDEDNAFSGMYMHYHYKRPKTDGVGDTLVALTYGIGFGWRFNHYENDFSNNPALARVKNGVAVNSKDNNGICVIQPSSGIGIRLEIPYLRNFYQKFNGEVNFQRAVLSLSPIEASLNSHWWLPPASIRLLYANSDGTPMRNGSIDSTLPTEGDSRTTATMYFLPNGWSYTDVKISGYLQAVADGTINNNGFILKGSDQENSVNRLLFNNAKTYPFPLKLQIYYTFSK